MTGTFVLSLDTELAWGAFDLSLGPALLRASRWAHDEGIPRILETLCKYRISATWAFVGHVALDRCAGHSEMEPVHYPWLAGDWFQHDPCSDEAVAPEWYGQSRFLQVRNAPWPQEIGFHSFSHVIFGHPGTPPRRARQEFAVCRGIAEQHGLAAASFVFPRNSVGYLDELRAAGFRCYRPPDLYPLAFGNPLLDRLGAVAADFLALAPRTVEPRLEDGLVAVPGSLLLRSLEGWRRFIPAGARLRRIRRGLRRCVEDGRVFHLWSHPSNFHAQPERMFTILEECCAEVDALRSAGRLRVATMGELAEEALSAPPLPAARLAVAH